jgi:hypothetical protein
MDGKVGEVGQLDIHIVRIFSRLLTTGIAVKTSLRLTFDLLTTRLEFW